MHINNGQAEPLPGVFDLPVFALFAEGHTGVSLFMVLSGYLFARITEGRELNYRRFLAARAWRLLPMLLTMLAILAFLRFVITGPEAAMATFWELVNGIWLPSIPYGGWSITVEFHFYLIFPLILVLERRRPGASLVILSSAMVIRYALYAQHSDLGLRDFAYWTILGRIDQFIIGILLARYGARLGANHLTGVAGIVGVIAYMGWFDRAGGFYGISENSLLWVVQWTLEGFFYGLVILWYDRAFRMPETGISGLIAKVGAASYSIYLLHGFFVFRMAELVDAYIVRTTNFYVAMAAAIICFIPVAGIGWLSFRYYERFWLSFRRSYSEKS